jgi:DNA-binding response OmpR family regulator
MPGPSVPAHDGARCALVVEDGPEQREIAAALLRREGFEVETVADGAGALEAVRRRPPDLVLLDVGLPDVDGIETCRRIREHSDAYVLMLTAHDTEIDKVQGLSAGADDYVTKPYSPVELVARVRALLRRPRGGAPAAPAAATERRFGELVVQPQARRVFLGEQELELTRTEFDLLDVLSAEPAVAFSRGRLLERVWDANWFGDDHLVDVHVSNLRRKLRDTTRPPRYVKTVRGVGYRMGDGA